MTQFKPLHFNVSLMVLSSQEMSTNHQLVRVHPDKEEDGTQEARLEPGNVTSTACFYLFTTALRVLIAPIPS